MGSWSYVSEGKGFMGFVELDSQDLMMRSSHGESLTTSDSGGALTAAPNGLTASSSKLSSSSSRDSSLIDLKLGGFADPPKMSNSLSSPAKRIRAGGGMNSQTPYCQVHGCKKDLSSCKDYHKRHKVCEVHSKTAKVIVNGIEQRFCQQCSRFHLLGEFDDGKRSCRKRLAGHNERRRKPHAGMSSGRAGRLFQTFSASRFQGTGFSSSSFVCQDILPGNIVNPHKFETTNEWYRNVKVEEGADFSHQLAMPLTNGQPPGKSLFGSYDSAKHCPPPARDGGICGISDTSSYLHDMAGADFGPRHVYHNASLGSEVLSPFETSSTIQGLSGLSNSERARSLLSPRSSSTSMAPLINHHYDMAQVSEKLLSQSGINSCEMMLFSNGGQSYSMNHQVVQGSEYMNMKNQINGRDGPTVDLLQLSSQLQRADHERNSMQVKQ